VTTFDVPAVPTSLDTVQDRFATWWDGLGVDDVAHRFALEHTARRDQQEGRRYTVQLEASDDTFTAVLRDNGLPVDIDLAAVTMADAEAESGRGLALALAALDRLEHRHEHGHNVWTLVCER
jgi:serine/threonine-protein kinase RsbW